MRLSRILRDALQSLGVLTLLVAPALARHIHAYFRDPDYLDLITGS